MDAIRILQSGRNWNPDQDLRICIGKSKRASGPEGEGSGMKQHFAKLFLTLLIGASSAAAKKRVRTPKRWKLSAVLDDTREKLNADEVLAKYVPFAPEVRNANAIPFRSVHVATDSIGPDCQTRDHYPRRGCSCGPSDMFVSAS